ncbi:hypothetical protein R1flu_021258 [Riccia fluitans]|uniref:Uncharacterized protein n=1 Tax=Riccia fluitans TaxID=41844 RepID=A0ABD1ZNU8_9MARC
MTTLAARTVPVPPFGLSRSIQPCWSSARLSTHLTFVWFYVPSSHIGSSAITPPFAVPRFHVVACLQNVSMSATPFPRASGSSSRLSARSSIRFLRSSTTAPSQPMASAKENQALLVHPNP